MGKVTVRGSEAAAGTRTTANRPTNQPSGTRKIGRVERRK
jgi:hypothetical protein